MWSPYQYIIVISLVPVATGLGPAAASVPVGAPNAFLEFGRALAPHDQQRPVRIDVSGLDDESGVRAVLDVPRRGVHRAADDVPDEAVRVARPENAPAVHGYHARC
jgi:hypothetical protein